MTVGKYIKFAFEMKDKTGTFPDENDWVVFLQGEYNMDISTARWISKRLVMCYVVGCNCQCHRMSIDKEEMQWALNRP